MRNSQVPMIRHARSSFDLSHDIKTSMNVGTLYPLDVIEVLPGDTFKGDITAVARVSSAFLKPVMDNLFMDVHAFFVPTRLIYKDTENVFGNPNPTAYTNNDFSVMPTNPTAFFVSQGSVGDYLGLPVGSVFAPGTLNLCPFRAFARVYNDWFRNQNTINETYIQTGEGSASEEGNPSPWSPSNYCGMPPKVMKRKDYFTSCLPQPQKGEPVEIAGGGVPVRYDASRLSGVQGGLGGWSFLSPSGTLVSINDNAATIDSNMSGYQNLQISPGALSPSKGAEDINKTFIYPTMPASVDLNLDVNDLRYSFALQKMLERDARAGSRMYSEAILANFGVSSPDSRLMQSQYLGGGRFPLSVQQVAQTSQRTEDSPLANVAGYSLSNGKMNYSQGFTEYGYVVICACIKQMHTYQQGVPRHFMRKERLDFYDTAFQSIGEQPVYTWQLYNPTGFGEPINTLRDGTIFGFQEAWAEYRQLPGLITGGMRSSSGTNFDIWHFADKYENEPTLSEDFTNESPEYVDRCLAVPSTSQDQFIVDVWHGLNAIRVLPTFSVPSLIDHH